jgi:hypothetical protein
VRGFSEALRHELIDSSVGLTGSLDTVETAPHNPHTACRT